MVVEPPPFDSSVTINESAATQDQARDANENTSDTEKPNLPSEHAPPREPRRKRNSYTKKQVHPPWWKFKFRQYDDEHENDWWFAGTAIPLLAATIGPLANVSSIAALVTYWRSCLVEDIDPSSCVWNGDDSLLVSEMYGNTFEDPRWCYWLNAASLILGFVGNLFLLFNFTNRVRYMIALPVTIIAWYLATGILTAITISMHVYVAPTRPQQTYTQGFWYAVIASTLYMTSSMLLMVNMLGHFLGHYPQQFNLTDSQRTLILQTMLFFIWLAGGAGVFSRVENGSSDFDWSYANALYFCDVTILTVGFGDLYPASNTGRGLVFPYSVGGIIMLGLVISSITKFAAELGVDNVLQKHVEKSRTRTIGRAVTTSLELRYREGIESDIRPTISGPINPVDRTMSLRIIDNKDEAKKAPEQSNEGTILQGIRKATTMPIKTLRKNRKPRLLLLREEKDRFEAMRRIQGSTAKWKRWYALTSSVIAFGTLWCVGAFIFWQAERRGREMTYFQALYLCYVSLLTIGYGDLAPQSNAGRPFFVVWSLVAVPTMTILVADMGDTIISNFKKATTRLADFTILPEKGIWHRFLLQNPWLLSRLQSHHAKKAASQRLAKGFPVGPNSNPNDGNDDDLDLQPPTLDTLAVEAEEGKKASDFVLGRKLAKAIRKVANDLRVHPPRVYAYEEWVEFTQLIRFTSKDQKKKQSHSGDEDGVDGEDDEEDEEHLIEWDWIGPDSPMMAQESEAEFVLDRLCESMGRYIRRLAPADLDVEGEVERPLDVREEDEAREGKRRSGVGVAGSDI